MVNDRVCFICGEANRELIEEHHIVPRRYGGSDNAENLVALCSSCHTAVERIYDDSFYARLGIQSADLQRELEGGGIDGEEIDTEVSLDRRFWGNSDHVRKEQAAATVVVSEDLEEEGAVMYYPDGSSHKPREERDDAGETTESPGTVVGDEEAWEYDYLVQNTEHTRNGRSVGWLTSVPNLSKIIDARKERVTEEMVFDEPCKMVLAPDDPRTEPLIVVINEKWDNKIGTDNYGGYRRLHCGYCDQVFAPYEHGLAARHLRVVHHITDPYEDEPAYDGRPILSSDQ